MKEATLIFPNQLFENHPGLEKDRPVILVEDFLFFRIQAFHKQRLILLRASMRLYQQSLDKLGYKTFFLSSDKCKKRGQWGEFLAQHNYKLLHLTDVTDDYLSQDLEKISQNQGIIFKTYDTPMFLCTELELKSYFSGKTKFSMASFYIYQREKLDVLIDHGKPLGGKYSFDTENRSAIAKNFDIPDPFSPKKNKILDEVITSIEKEFPESIGSSEGFSYPVTHDEAMQSLDFFLKSKLQNFGTYEDAIVEGEPYLFHSVLSPSLNIGLITPDIVLEKTLQAFKEFKYPLNSVEGFVRQIIGWREFMRAAYILKGKSQRTKNFFKHKNSLPHGFWNGDLGIEPLDKTIKSVLKIGYCHHIERLMVLGNFMLLLETHPDDVYEWFMALFVDAYDWVMVPNVYAMSQYADGGEITTKPYVSGSNYILKMSHYKKGDWCDVWDGLFWGFLIKHKDLFSKNPRIRMLFSYLEKNEDKILEKISKAKKWKNLSKHQ